VTQHALEIEAPEGTPTIVTRRAVTAPRSIVFDAFTKPEHLQKWLGPKAFTFVRCDNDLRVGGAYRFVYRTPDGGEVAFRGVYKDIVRPERIVRTFLFEGAPADEADETLALTETAGETTITTTTVHKTVAARDAHLRGMSDAMGEGYARLDDLLTTLAGAHDPLEDVRQGLGLLFRAAKGAIEKLPTKEVETAVVSGAREVGRAIESVGKTIEREVFKKGSGGEGDGARKPDDTKP
jgi:uncharacterized protein YndB with AHSA1/START domain